MGGGLQRRGEGLAVRWQPKRSAAGVWLLTVLSAVPVLAQLAPPAEKPAATVPGAKPAVAEPTAPRSAPEGASVGAKPALERLPTDILYLKNEKGELVPVPRDASVEGYLEFLRQQKGASAPAPPPLSVTSVELQGTIDGDMAQVQAKVVVEVTSTPEWPVAMGLTEAVIQQARVQSSGRALYAGKDPERGYQWWLVGAGTYEFDLQLGIPLRKSPPRRRLLLSLPPSPVTSARLLIHSPDVAPRIVPEEAVLQVMPQEHGTEIYATGFGTRLDVSWQSLPTTTSSSASLDANTMLLVRGAADGLYVEATQLVRALQGVFREVEVRLPDQAELLQVDGPDIAETRTDPDRPSDVTISLTGPTAGPVTLRWRVRIPHAERRRLVLEGFSVAGAKQQSGSIGLVEVDDARWAVIEAGEPHLERMNLAEFRALSNGVPVVRAYRFYAQPFRLPVTLEAVAAYYEVQPVFALYAAEDEIRLEGRFRVRMFRGQLDQLTLHWPGWRAEGWVLEGIQPQGSLVTGFTTNEAGASEGRIVINLSNRAKDSFEVRFSARRSRRGGEDSRLTLPWVESSGTALPATQVVLVPAVNVDAELSPRGETVLRRVARETPPAAEEFGFEKGLRTELYRLETEERQLSLRVTPQPQRIRVRSAVTARLTSRRLEVRQTVQHIVQYGRINDFAMVVPAEIADRVVFRHGDLELVPEWVEASRATEKVAWLSLPSVPLGTVAIDVSWSLPLPETWLGERSVPLEVPLVRSEFSPTDQTTLEVQRTGWFEVSTDDPQWLLQHADDERVRWQTSAAVSEFPLVLAPADDARNAPYHVTRAVMQVWLDRQGGQVCRFQARLSGGGPDFYLQLPTQASVPKVWWGQRPLSGTAVVEIPAGSRQFSLRLPEPVAESSEPVADAAEQLLTVEYELSTRQSLGGTASVVLWAPRLPHCQWIGQVIWDVHLPMEHHLWSPPPAAAAMYHWERTGWYWQRVSYPSEDELNVWVRGELRGPPALPSSPPGRRYAFRQLGKAQELRFRTLSTPMALVLGGGCSIVLGFLALRLDWLRSLVMVLAALCALVVLSLWYLSELELLFQPMLVGAVFPLLIAAAEAWHQRRTLAATWALSASVSDYRTASVDVPPTQSLQPARGDSATVFRAAPQGESSSARLPAESQAG